MSYILEALRKAERDRNLGRTPSLEDVTHAPIGSPAPVRSRRVIALAALVIGLLVLAVVFWPDAPQSPPEPAAVQVLAQAPEAAAPPAAEPLAAPPPVVGPDVADVPIEEPPPAESLDDLLDPSAEVAAASPSAAIEEPETSTDEAAAPEQVPAAVPGPETALKTEATAPVEPEVPEASGYKLLREMPADYRAAFANLRVDVHVYDADPARRWVMIEGKKYVEASSLPQGPRIAEITPEGVAFEFRGQTALFPLNR